MMLAKVAMHVSENVAKTISMFRACSYMLTRAFLERSCKICTPPQALNGTTPVLF